MLKTTIAAASDSCTASTRGIARAEPNCGSAESAITQPPTGSVAAPVTAIRPFGPIDHAGRREAVHREERRHQREATADDDRAHVALPRARTMSPPRRAPSPRAR